MRNWLIKLLGGCVLNHRDYYDDDERKFFNSKETIMALKEALAREVLTNIELSTALKSWRDAHGRASKERDNDS